MTAPIGALIHALKCRLSFDSDAAATFPPELHGALLDEEHTLISTAVAPSFAQNISHAPGFRFIGSLHNATVNGLHHSPLTEILAMDLSSVDVQLFLNSYERAPFTSTLLHPLHFFIIFLNASVYAAAFPSLPSPWTEERELTWPQHQRVSLASHPYQATNGSQHIMPTPSPLAADSEPANSSLLTNLPATLAVPTSAALGGNTIAEVCDGLGIAFSSVHFKQYRGAKAPLFEIVQLCLRVERLLHSLGYRPAKGGLKTEFYIYGNGHKQSFADILTELGWTANEYQKKISLFHWAEDAVANKTWKQSTRLPPSQGK